MLKTICIYIMLVIGLSSFGQEPQKQAWIELDYQSCLQDSLPCDCYSFNPPNFIYFNIESTNFILIDHAYAILNHQNSDTISFNIIERSKLINEDYDSLQGDVKIIKDSMYINLDNRLIKYVMIDDWISNEDSACVKYINNTLVANGYDDLYKTLKADSLFCDCDIQFWISRVHDNKNVWTFEQRQDVLYMYKWKYPKEMGKKARKKLYKKYKLESKSL